MRTLIKNFPDQLLESINISNQYSVNLNSDISNIVICGLGGSGIGGEIIARWALEEGIVPIYVCHSYRLPGFVSEDTLVITCSYSGNTEETISAYNEAIEKKALVIGITSGGKLEALLGENDNLCIKIPGGLPPRSALGYSIVQLAEIFDQLKIVRNSIKEKISGSLDLLRGSQEQIEQDAKNLVDKVGNNKLLLYSEDSFSPVLLRACQQINENSKELGFYNVIPEMNHNEIVGWANDPKDMFTIFVRSKLELYQNKKRLDITQNIISDRTDSIIAINAIGENLVEQTLYLIHLFDWYSLLKAEGKKIDVVEVRVIDFLKSQLAKA